MMVTARILPAERQMLISMNFTHVVYGAMDVSMKIPGSVTAAFKLEVDAVAEAERLSTLYRLKDSFAVEEL